MTPLSAAELAVNATSRRRSVCRRSPCSAGWPVSQTEPAPHRERSRSLVREVLGVQLAITAIGGLDCGRRPRMDVGRRRARQPRALGRAVGVGVERARRAVLLGRRRRRDARRRALHRQVSRDRARHAGTTPTGACVASLGGDGTTSSSSGAARRRDGRRARGARRRLPAVPADAERLAGPTLSTVGPDLDRVVRRRCAVQRRSRGRRDVGAVASASSASTSTSRATRTPSGRGSRSRAASCSLLLGVSWACGRWFLKSALAPLSELEHSLAQLAADAPAVRFPSSPYTELRAIVRALEDTTRSAAETRAPAAASRESRSAHGPREPPSVRRGARGRARALRRRRRAQRAVLRRPRSVQVRQRHLRPRRRRPLAPARRATASLRRARRGLRRAIRRRRVRRARAQRVAQRSARRRDEGARADARPEARRARAGLSFAVQHRRRAVARQPHQRARGHRTGDIACRSAKAHGRNRVELYSAAGKQSEQIAKDVADDEPPARRARDGPVRAAVPAVDAHQDARRLALRDAAAAADRERRARGPIRSCRPRFASASWPTSTAGC